MATDPFTVLGISHDADDETVHQAYLEQLRQHPPERAPERFQEIRTAFEQLKTERDRIQYRFFLRNAPNPSVIKQYLLTPGEPKHASEAELMHLLEGTLRAYRLKWDT